MSKKREAQPPIQQIDTVKILKIFISWSEQPSGYLAEILKSWIELVFTDVVAFCSRNDIDAGTSWYNRISRELDQSSIGILCVTASNFNNRWLLFEAGALSKHLEESKVIPLLLGMSDRDLSPPLSMFNCVEFDEKGVESLISSVNNSRGLPVGEIGLKALFETWWPKLKGQVDEALKKHEVDKQKPPKKRSTDDVLNEILNIVKSIAGEGIHRNVITYKSDNAASRFRDSLIRRVKGELMKESDPDKRKEMETRLTELLWTYIAK